jgi:endonuclease/exonuclease/phosphatase (EEP) superfamily protein YafD
VTLPQQWNRFETLLKIKNRFITSTCRRAQTLWWCSQYHCLPFSLTCLEPLHTHKFVRRRLLCCLSLQTSGTTLHLPFAAGSTLATNPARVVDHDRARSYFLRNTNLGEGTDITMKVQKNYHEERSQHFRKK